MTHLGLVSAVAAAAKGFETVASMPTRPRSSARAPASCPCSSRICGAARRHRARIAFSADAADLGSCDVVYIAPDVPTDDAGQERPRRPRPPDRAGDRRRCGRDAVRWSSCARCRRASRARAMRAGRRLYYQVETLIFGRAVERALSPERFIVGCADPAAAAAGGVAELPRSVRLPDPADALRERRAGQDLDQLCLVSSVSVANTLAELCERIGADWSEIVPALKLDRRIGAARVSGARPRHCRRQPRARPGDRHPHRRGDRHRRGRGARLDRQQPASPRLGARTSSACCSTRARRHDCHVGLPTRKTPFGEELAVAGNDAANAGARAAHDPAVPADAAAHTRQVRLAPKMS